MSGEAAAVFMRRAQAFAEREAREGPGVLKLPVTWMAYYLAYRGGVSVDDIAAWVEVGRVAIARTLQRVMAMRNNPVLAARLDILVEQVGRVRYEHAGAEIVRFPGPVLLVRREYVAEGAA